MKPIHIYLIFLTLTVLLHSCGVQPQSVRIPAGPSRSDILKTATLQTTAQLLQQADTVTREYFEAALAELEKMLQGTLAPDFERAVFISEQPYHNNRYSYEAFQQEISFHTAWIALLIAANDGSDTMDFDVPVNRHGHFNLADLRFPPAERKTLYRKALANWAIFTYITDTTAIYPLYHPSFSYVSHDPFGIRDWRNSQVLGLLSSPEQQGNCFALTAFYKILADRLDTDAHLCTAPQHIYIRHRDPKGDYYNVELATAGHPGDGTIQTLTHTTPDAVQNGIALRSYDARQSIGLCLVQLAKSYEHRYRTKADDFLLRCADLALRYDSLNLNALLLRQQVLDARVNSYASARQINDISQLKADPAISETVYELEAHLSRLYRLGYRQMPGYMQEIIMTGRYPENFEDKNPTPFTTIDPKDEHRRQYQGLYRGLFQEVFEKRASEPYGHFTLNTTSHTLSHIDTTTPTGHLIDPVAFAYDFGARMYDARIGRFTSVDPLATQYPFYTPYQFAGNKPIQFIDLEGLEESFNIRLKQMEQGYLKGTVSADELLDFFKHSSIGAGLGAALTATRGAILRYGPRLLAWGANPVNQQMLVGIGGLTASIIDPNPAADYPGSLDDVGRGIKLLIKDNQVSKFIINSSKFDFFFGKVKAGKNATKTQVENAFKSSERADIFKKLGIEESNKGKEILLKLFNDALTNGKEINRYVDDYGTTITKQITIKKGDITGTVNISFLYRNGESIPEITTSVPKLAE